MLSTLSTKTAGHQENNNASVRRRFRSRHAVPFRHRVCCIVYSARFKSIFVCFVLLQAGYGTPLRLTILLLFLTFVVITANQTCEQKASEMNYVLDGHAHSALKLNEYPSCLKACLGDGKCVSFNYNFVTLLCELSDKTKAMEPDSFIEKKYSSYTEVLR